MSGKEDTGGGDVTGGGVRTPDGPGTGQTMRLRLGAQWDRAQIWWRCPHPVEQPWLQPCLYSRKAPLEIHQGNNLTASIELTWDNTSWRVALIWLIICALCLACLLACLACLCSHLSANSCVSWMSSHSSWALAWLASHRSLREGWYPNPSVWVLAGWQPNPPSVWVQAGWLSNPPLVWVHSSRSEAGASRGIDREMGLERQCSSSDLSHRNSGRWGYVFKPSSPTLHGSSTSDSLKGSSCTNAACLREIGQK